MIWEESKIGNSIKELAKDTGRFIGVMLNRYRWIRFGIVGGIGSLIHLAVLFSLTEFIGLWYLFSAFFAVLIAATNNYILNNIWTFQERKNQNHVVGWLKYISLASVFDLFYFLLLVLLTEIVGLWYILSAVFSLLLVFPFRYTLSKLWVWKGFQPSKMVSDKHPDDADYEWHAYAKGSPVQKWWKLSISKVVSDYLPGDPFLLDIGCGSSPMISRYRGVSVDCNSAKIEFMTSINGNTNHRKYMVADAGSLPFENSSFDAVMCVEVIEHIENPEKVIAEIARTAKIGARIVLATPDYSKPLAYVIDMMTPYGDDHIFRFTRRNLERICRSYGLVPVKHKYVGTCDLVALFEKVDG